METRRHYIVGREEQVRLLDRVVHGTLPHRVINIYGPGGIGKTVVCERFEEYCARMQIPYARVTGDDATIQVDKMLCQFREGLVKNVPGVVSSLAWADFDKKLYDYLVVEKVIAQGGGISKLFDLAGNLLDHALLKVLLRTVGGAYDGLQGYFANRDALERYIGGAEAWLTDSFVKSIISLTEKGIVKLVLLVDGYEAMASLDDWMCGTLARALPPDVKVFLLGRDRLGRINCDWSEYSDLDLHYHELNELSEQEAKAYLRHYDLTDADSLDRVYQFTGGYPLCLALAVELSKELGWNGVRRFQDPANRDRVASQLLDRILRQEKVKEIQEFLEKGVVVRWFDPGAVSYILQVSPERGREIYDKIGKFSFVQPHPNGLKFHDKVRELLVERLKFVDNGQTYARLAERWSDYLKARAGV